MIQRALFLLLGALAAVLAAELALRMLPVSTSTNTGYHVAPNILTYPPRHEWTMATGWDLRNVQHLRSNNLGFPTDRDFSPGSNALGLVGDSYVEATMLPPEERPAAQLENALGGQIVYALGGSGSSLLDYAERIEWAYRTLGLRTFVVMMEHADASQSICGSGNVHARCLLPETLEPVIRRQPPSGPIKKLLRESALAQYAVSQLKISAARWSSSDFWRTGSPANVVKSEKAASLDRISRLDSKQQKGIDAVLDEFFKQIDSLDGARVLFVIDMNRRNLENGIFCSDESYHVAERLRARGHAVVQGEPLYREHLRRSPLRLEVGPHDQHLNAIGVALLMDATAKTLQQDSINSKGK